MFFNSIDFAIFLPIVFVLYWFILNKNLTVQNILLLVASYLFYACWDYRFLFLLIFSTLLDYYTGLKMYRSKTTSAKRIWFWISVTVNLGFLAALKYFNFFIDSFAQSAELLGFHVDVWTLQVVLPVGISFYTFHGLSYVIDIYKDRITPVTNFIDYSVFVSFFPLLVAGPIERATHLLPQIQKERTFNYSHAVDGLRQILWGLFKKIIIADYCAEYADLIFNNYSTQSGSTLLLGAVFFAFQIYADFSGYSDIALGTARIFGIELLRNFAFPYFSRDIAEFWRRWHISLTTWFRDYLYIPLGGSKGNKLMQVRNTFIVFLVSGLWHGANWTFLAWGAINAAYFIPLLLLKKHRDNIEIVAQGRWLPTIKELMQMSVTFLITVLAWIFFRSETIGKAFAIFGKVFSRSLFSLPTVFPALMFAILAIFIIIEWAGREQKYALEKFAFNWPRTLRWTFYTVLAVSVLMFCGQKQQFIYFQF